mmetsp:Transcript_26647/g.63200  ORF Transcript_26647/g.63200 Transcript_26647/m.63200 type:complete len:82 (-) Transcript_26647:1028-1273(-)
MSTQAMWVDIKSANQYFNKREDLAYQFMRRSNSIVEHEQKALFYMNLMTLERKATSGAECTISISRNTTISDPSANLGFTT